MLVLNVTQGPDRGKRFDLPDNEPQLVGRSSEALPLHDQTISRRHAELTPDEGEWYIRDLQSANGTYVNGQRITDRWKLAAGDQVRCGNTMFMFGVSKEKPRKSHGLKVGRDDEIDAHVEAKANSDDSMIMSVPEPSEAAVLQLRILYEMVQLIGSVHDRQELLEKIMDVIFEFFQADRGFILLQAKPEERPDPVVVRHKLAQAGQTELQQRKSQPKIVVSRSIVQHVLRRGEGVLSSNAMVDERFSSSESVHDMGIRSALCVPIKFKAQNFGVIHVDSMIANYTYTEDQLVLLTAVGVQTGLALANLDLMEQRMHRERLAAVGQTVASLSHSIKNIIQGLHGGGDVVDLGLRKNDINVMRSGWGIVTRNLQRIYMLATNMLHYSKQRRPEVELTSLVKVLQECVSLMQGQFDAKKAALITDFADDLPPVPVDTNGIMQAVLNLLNNALEAVAEQKGVVTLRCDMTDDYQFVRIQVADNGEGIDPVTQRRLFEPFHSTKGMRGTGLGLVVTKKIVEEHGGRVLFESATQGPDHGTTMTLLLPTAGAKGPTSADTHAPRLSSDDTNTFFTQ